MFSIAVFNLERITDSLTADIKISDNNDSKNHILEDWTLILLVGLLFWLCGRPPSHPHPYHSEMIAVSIGTHRI
jgi:hypothetical protein